MLTIKKKIIAIMYLAASVSKIFGGEISLIDQIGQGQEDTTGIRNAGKVLASSDGKYIYVGSNNQGRITQFSPSSTNGHLTFLSSSDSLGIIMDMVFDPSEKNLYLSTYYNNTIECYSRNQINGSITYQNSIRINPNQNWFDIPTRLCINKQGNNLYVISMDAVSVFARNLQDGSLEFKQILINGKDNISNLGGAFDIDISQDGKFAYITSYKDSCISWFSRDSIGILSKIGFLSAKSSGCNVLKRPELVKVADNGKYLIVASGAEGAIGWFSRNQTTGAVSFSGELLDHGPNIFGFYYINEFSIFNNGTRLITAAEQSTALCSIDTSTGSLRWLESINLQQTPNMMHLGMSVCTVLNNYIYLAGYEGKLSIIKWIEGSNKIAYRKILKENIGQHKNSLTQYDLLGRQLLNVKTNRLHTIGHFNISR